METINWEMTTSLKRVEQGTAAQGRMEGLENDADTGGDSAASDGDIGSDEQGGGDGKSDTGSDNVGIRGRDSGGGTGTGQVPAPDDSVTDGDADEVPGGGTAGSQPGGTQTATGGDTETTTVGGSGTAPGSQNPTGGGQTLADRVRARHCVKAIKYNSLDNSHHILVAFSRCKRFFYEFWVRYNLPRNTFMINIHGWT